MAAAPGPAACPSAQPDMQDAQLLGVVSGPPEAPRLAYLNARLPVSDALLKAAEPVPAIKVMRFAARCEEQKCTHFDGSNCTLAQRVVSMLPEVTEMLPPCVIRSTCRWYRQEGRAACMRCPQIVTLADMGDETKRRVAQPEG